MCASERAVDGIEFLTHRRTIASVGGGAQRGHGVRGGDDDGNNNNTEKEKVFNTFCCFQKNEFSSRRCRRRRRRRHQWLFTHTYAIMRKLWKLCMEIMPEHTEFYLSLFGSVSTRFDSWWVCLRCLFRFYVIFGCVRRYFASRIASTSEHHSGCLCVCERVWDGSLCSHSPNWKFSCRTLAARFYHLNCEICRRKLVECFGDQILRTQLDMSSVLDGLAATATSSRLKSLHPTMLIMAIFHFIRWNRASAWNDSISCAAFNTIYSVSEPHDHFQTTKALTAAEHKTHDGEFDECMNIPSVYLFVSTFLQQKYANNCTARVSNWRAHIKQEMTINVISPGMAPETMVNATQATNRRRNNKCASIRRADNRISTCSKMKRASHGTIEHSQSVRRHRPGRAYNFARIYMSNVDSENE